MRAAAVRRAERGAGKGIVEGIVGDMAPMPGEDEASPSKFISRHETTQAQWEALMDGNPSRFRGADLPVDNVTIAECLEFISRLNRLPTVREAGLEFRLPTEDEWKMSAVNDPFNPDALRFLTLPYSGEEEWHGAGWFLDNSGGTTHPVGQKAANRSGFFDMWGNVAEPTAPPTGIISMDGMYGVQFGGFPCMGGSIRKNVTLFDGIRFVGGGLDSLPDEFKPLFDGMEVPEGAWEPLAPDDPRRDTIHGETLGLRLAADKVAGKGP